MSPVSHTSTQTPFERIGGKAAIELVVHRFYDLMDLESKYQALRSVHHEHLDMSREKLILFLTGWMGGPQLYVEQYGHPRLRMRHMPFKIGVTERDQWVACMAQAMRELEVEASLFDQLMVSFYGTAEWMRNQTDAVEGNASMPNQVGADVDGSAQLVRQKLNAIGQQYGVAI